MFAPTEPGKNLEGGLFNLICGIGSAGCASFGDATKLGGAGGGVIVLTASNLITVNGTLTAAGRSGTGSGAGGGSGGSIWISANSISGAGTVESCEMLINI